MDERTFNIQQFFIGFFGKNADPGGYYRKSDAWCNIPWEQGIEEPIIQNTIRELTKTPARFLYAKTIPSGRFDNEVTQTALNTADSFIGNSTIDMTKATKSLKCLSLTDKTDENCLTDLLTGAFANIKRKEAEARFLEKTGKKYKRIHVYRVMKTASSSLTECMRHYSLGDPPYRNSHAGFKENTAQEVIGRMSGEGIVECSWSPIATSTKCYNFYHSHYPISKINSQTRSTYSLISIREPIQRMASFFNMNSMYFKDEEDFIRNCHEDWLFGQIYFCDQKKRVQQAKTALRKISRVLIVENSTDWIESINSDLCSNIKTTALSKQVGNRSSKNTIAQKIEELISKDTDLSKKLDQEYELYNYALRLSRRA